MALMTKIVIGAVEPRALSDDQPLLFAERFRLGEPGFVASFELTVVTCAIL